MKQRRPQQQQPQDLGDRSEEIRQDSNVKSREVFNRRQDFKQVLFVGFILGSVLTASWYHSSNMSARQYRRSTIASNLAAKTLNDRALLEEDKSEWYRVRTSKLTQEKLKKTFVQSGADEETMEFISNCVDKSDAFFTQLYHNIATYFLSFFYTKTDINGMLDRGLIRFCTNSSKSSGKMYESGHSTRFDVRLVQETAE